MKVRAATLASIPLAPLEKWDKHSGTVFSNRLRAMPRRAHKRSASDVSDVALDLLHVLTRALINAECVFNATDHAVQWLKEPNEALGGALPLNLLATVEGTEIVRAELGTIEHGLAV